MGEFDYLSTVSAGARLGAWFSAWATRIAKHPNTWIGPGTPDQCDGPARVIEELSKHSDCSLDPEPLPVRLLRYYTGYLGFRFGLFASETWALVATLLGNLFLNWLVILPLFATLLLLPVLAYQLSSANFVDSPRPETIWVYFLSGIALASLGSSYMGYDLPSVGNTSRSSKWFVCLSLIPTAISAVHLDVFWAWLPLGNRTQPWWNIVALGKVGLCWYHFGLFGVYIYVGGLLIAATYLNIRHGRVYRRAGLAVTVAAVATGFIGGILAFWVTQLFELDAEGHLRDPKLYAFLGFPLTIGVFLVSTALLGGATSYFAMDEDREWWARAAGWFVAAAFAWTALALIALYAAPSLTWLNAQLSASLTALTGFTGWAAVRLSANNSVNANVRPEKASELPKVLSSRFVNSYANRLIAPTFLILLSILVSRANLKLLKLIDNLPNMIPSFWPSILAPAAAATEHALWLALAYLALCGIASWFIAVNKFSFNSIYRLRLIRVYLGASNSNRLAHRFTGFDENDNIAMCALTSHKPLHIINAGVNLVQGSNLAWQNRIVESFTFTRLHCGGRDLAIKTLGFTAGRTDVLGGIQFPWALPLLFRGQGVHRILLINLQCLPSSVLFLVPA